MALPLLSLLEEKPFHQAVCFLFLLSEHSSCIYKKRIFGKILVSISYKQEEAATVIISKNWKRPSLNPRAVTF